MDLHAPQIQGFFRIPVDNLYALPVLCDHIRAMDLPNPVVVSPDIGFAKRARDFARHLGASIAIAEKERIGHDEKPAVLDVIGDVAGKTALIVDDFTISGRTLIEVAGRVLALGATDAYAVVTHGVLAAGTVARIAASPIARLLMTDTVESQPDALSGAIEVVSVAPLFGEAIKRIHDRESISAMFPP
jgi:ribose-phosphate pyrophosphokinase